MTEVPAQVLLRVLDTETTGLDPAVHDLIELGWTDVLFTPATRDAVVLQTQSKLFGAPRGIPSDAMAVHHIIPSMVADCPPATPEALEQLVTGRNEEVGLSPTFAVAHNAAFDRMFIPVSTIYWICTFKVACRAVTDSPSHNNQVLRYHLDLPVAPVRADPPHRAGPDSYVTAHLLVALLKRVGLLSQMEAWTRAPRFYASCPLKKHKGQAWADVPGDYLTWMLRQPEMEPDLKAAATAELDYRRDAYAEKMAALKTPVTPETPA